MNIARTWKLSDRKLSKRKLVNAKIYSHEGVIDTIGLRSFGAYIDSKTEAWSGLNCSTTSGYSCGCCGNDGPPYYNCNSCTYYYLFWGNNRPSSSFNLDPTFGYKDGNNKGYKSFVTAGTGGTGTPGTSTWATCATNCSSWNEDTLISAGAVLSGTSYAGIRAADGTLWLWGYNGYGQLGDGTTTSRKSPVQLGSNSWKMISGGTSYNFAAIRSDDTLWLWGSGANGNLGVGDTSNYSSPVQVAGTWSYVHCGDTVTAGIKTDGTLWLWGTNYYGNLGDGTITARSSPVQVSGGGSWRYVFCGYYTSFGIKSDGKMYAWGRGDSGQLGDGFAVTKSSPVQAGSAFSDWQSVRYTNPFVAHAIRSNGAAYSWGYYALGTGGSGGQYSSPIQIGSSLVHASMYTGVTDNYPRFNSLSYMPFVTKTGNLIGYSSYSSTQTTLYGGGSATECISEYKCDGMYYPYPNIWIKKYVEIE